MRTLSKRPRLRVSAVSSRNRGYLMPRSFSHNLILLDFTTVFSVLVVIVSILCTKMTSFSTATLEKKLSDLSNTQHSVQTLSLWLIHHRKHAKAIVQAWYKELAKGKQIMANCLNLVREQSIALDCNQITFGPHIPI